MATSNQCTRYHRGQRPGRHARGSGGHRLPDGSRLDPGRQLVRLSARPPTASPTTGSPSTCARRAGQPTDEGNIAANAAPKRATRITNACEIFYESYGVSGTYHGGRQRQRPRPADRAAPAQGPRAPPRSGGRGAGPSGQGRHRPTRQMSGVQTFAGYFSVGVGGTAPTSDGATAVVYGITSQALSATLLDDVMQQGWQFGARYSLYLMSSAQKRNFDLVIPVENLTENQVDVTNEDGVTVVSTVAIWKSTFGQIKFIMDPVLDQYHRRVGRALHPRLRRARRVPAQGLLAARARLGGRGAGEDRRYGPGADSWRDAR